MDISTDPLDPALPWSPFAECGTFDIDVDDVNVLADARRLIYQMRVTKKLTT
jgi:hypothetical protein